MKRLPPAAKGPTLRLLEFVYNLIEGDHIWAERRSILLVTALIIFMLMGRATEQITEWWVLAANIENLPGPVVFVLSFLHPQTWRHLLLPLAGMVLALGVAANYVRDLFDLSDLNTGNEYIKAAMFGQEYPTINLKSTGYELDIHYLRRYGKEAQVAAHPIVKIGGPGYVTVAPGNVALYERVGGPSKVAGAGQHYLRRFETLREVIDLRDQIRERPEVKALTKDGLAVTVQNVQVSFRVRTSNRPRTEKEVYPFSVSAVKRIAYYGKTVGVKGASVWSEGVPNAVAGNIRSYISRSLLDDLVSRSDTESKDPRDKIKAVFEHKDTRKRFSDMGVDLLWVSLGHIKTDSDVLTERIYAWGAEWDRAAQNTLSQAEAEKLKLMEYAKTMARLELIEKGIKNLTLNVNDTPSYDRIVIQIMEVLNTTGRKVRAAQESAMGSRMFMMLPMGPQKMDKPTLEDDKPASQKVIQAPPVAKGDSQSPPPPVAPA